MCSVDWELLFQSFWKMQVVVIIKTNCWTLVILFCWSLVVYLHLDSGHHLTWLLLNPRVCLIFPSSALFWLTLVTNNPSSQDCFNNPQVPVISNLEAVGTTVLLMCRAGAPLRGVRKVSIDKGQTCVSSCWRVIWGFGGSLGSFLLSSEGLRLLDSRCPADVSQW